MLEVSRPTLSSVTLSGAVVLAGTSLGFTVCAAQNRFSGLDHGMRELVRLARHPWLGGPMETVSMLGDGSGLIPLIALACVLLWRTSPRWALTLPVIMAGAGALQFLAKWAVDRPRPNLSPWGFPSGHVLALVVFFGLVIYLTHRLRGPVRAHRSLATVLAVTLVLTVAFSRLYLDVHWFSDLVGGLFLGLAYLLTAISLVEHTRNYGAVYRRTEPTPGLPARAPGSAAIM